MCAMVKESNSTRWPANNSQKYTKNVQTRVTLGVLSLTHFPTFYNQPTWQMLRHGKGFGHSLVTPSYKRKVTRVFFFSVDSFFFQNKIVCTCGTDLSSIWGWHCNTQNKTGLQKTKQQKEKQVYEKFSHMNTTNAQKQKNKQTNN